MDDDDALVMPAVDEALLRSLLDFGFPEVYSDEVNKCCMAHVTCCAGPFAPSNYEWHCIGRDSSGVVACA